MTSSTIVDHELAAWVEATEDKARRIAQAARSGNRVLVLYLVEQLMELAEARRLESCQLDPEDPLSLPLAAPPFEPRDVAMLETQLGITTLRGLLETHPTELAAMKNVGDKTVKRIQQTARHQHERIEQLRQAPYSPLTTAH